MLRATVGASPGDPEGLRNVNTFPLPDGAGCYVIAARSMYYLDKTSTATESLPNIVAPVAGPGRWVQGPVAAAGAGPAFLYSSANNAYASNGGFNASSTGNFGFTIPDIGSPAGWALTATGGILTYQGAEAADFLVTLNADVAPAEATAGFNLFGVVSLDDDSPSVAAGGAAGVTSTPAFTDAVSYFLSSQRLVHLVPGTSTLRPKFAAASGTTSLSVSLSMSIVKAS
jgi:hypothetical protein